MSVERTSSIRSRWLDPTSSLGEIMFGLIMTLTFTLGAGIIIEDEGREGAKELPADHHVWDSVAWALAQLCHAIVCAAAPRRIAMGGGVTEGHPHLLPRINAMLVKSLNAYVPLPSDGDYVRAPELGANAGPLGAIALGMTAMP